MSGSVANADDALNLQNSGKVTFPDKSDKNPPLFISAEQMNGLENVFIDAQGKVDLHRGLIEVQADHLHYLLASDQVEANGNVCVIEQGLVLTGPHLDMLMQKQTGQMTAPQFTFQNSTATPATPKLAPALGSTPSAGPTVSYARGSASQLLFEGENQYQLKNATYTSCVIGNDDWYLHLKDLHLDMLNQVGTAHGAVIDFMQTPILYTPWISFPLDNSRKSGLLAPIFGTTSNSGASLALPFYWNIAPNMDATIAPDIISKRGIELDGEFRYLEPTYHGTFNGDILQDHMTNTTRWDIFATHDQVFAPGLSGHFVYQAVSDNNFFRDLSNQLTVTSLATLDQEASLTYQHDWWQLTGHVQQYQTLQETGVPSIIPPYAILPEVNWSVNKILDNGLNVNVYTDFAIFVNPTH
jgi:LPS-assembly protein